MGLPNRLVSALSPTYVGQDVFIHRLKQEMGIWARGHSITLVVRQTSALSESILHTSYRVLPTDAQLPAVLLVAKPSHPGLTGRWDLTVPGLSGWGWARRFGVSARLLPGAAAAGPRGRRAGRSPGCAVRPCDPVRTGSTRPGPRVPRLLPGTLGNFPGCL